MEIPLWLQIAIVLLLIWTAIVVVLLIVGRVVLAREMALIAPNLVRLFTGLLRDGRVPLHAKAVLAVASLWLASPIDLIPEFIPILGSLDDAIVAAIAMRFLLETTDGHVVREHWPGEPATLDRVMRIALVGRRGTPRALR